MNTYVKCGKLKKIQQVLLTVWKDRNWDDIPEEWWNDGVTTIPFDTAMWDEVFVDKEKVKIDYNITGRR